MASFPTTPAVFPARSDGQTIFSQHINALQDEIAALEAAMIGGTLPSPQVIAATPPSKPTLILTTAGQVAKSRLIKHSSVLGVSAWTDNLDVDGAGALTLADDLTIPSVYAQLNATNTVFVINSAPAGANPRAASTLFKVDCATGAIAERGRAFNMGEWQTVPFNIANFWTGVTAAMIGVNRYCVIGKTVIWQLTMAGAPAPGGTWMYFGIPYGVMVNVSSAGPAGTIFVNEGANVNAPNSLSWGNASSIAITKLASVSWTSVLNIVSATFIYGIQ